MRVLEASDLQPVRHNCTECFILTVQNVTDRTEFAAIPVFSFCTQLEWRQTPENRLEWNDHEQPRSIPTVPTRPNEVNTHPEKKRTPSRLRKNDTYLIRSSGEGGGEERRI